jgi:hypothetical protein
MCVVRLHYSGLLASTNFNAEIIAGSFGAKDISLVVVTVGAKDISLAVVTVVVAVIAVTHRHHGLGRGYPQEVAEERCRACNKV